MKKYRRFLLLIAIITLFVGAGYSGSAAASSQVVFDSAKVGLWPERSGQSIFVSLDLLLSSDVELPQVLVIQVPVTAVIESLRIIDERGSVQQAAWEETGGEIWKDVEFTVTASNILIEYTDPTLVFFDQLRTYSFSWNASYSVNDLVISVRQPYGAGDLITHPDSDVTEGCCTQVLNAGRVVSGESFDVTFHYVKDLENTDYQALSVAPVATVDENTEGRTILPSTVVVWLLAVALLLILLVGFYYWWFQRRYINEERAGTDRWLMRRSEHNAIFCHECGSRSQPGDGFCRNCGTELRKKEK
ncbi:MAG: zinc ribbon domain-containing protein [Anaerolineaceae bacterium]|nr:zinc ribbon domain-containing protein [Anaerolineaceae bacterium]